MRQETGFTMLALHPMYQLFQNKAAVKELCRILSGKICEESVYITEHWIEENARW